MSDDLAPAAPREIARVTLILSESGFTFENAPDDLAVLHFLLDSAQHALKQMQFTNYMRVKQAQHGIVPGSPALLERLKNGSRK